MTVVISRSELLITLGVGMQHCGGVCLNGVPRFTCGNVKGALAWYGKLTWESAHAWILIILCYFIVWGITLIFMVRLNFYAIPLLIYDVMNDITIIP